MLVGVVLCAYLILLFILNLQPIRQLWVNEVKIAISNKIGTAVDVEDIEIGLFDRITVNGLTLLDQNGETLLNVNKFSSKISLTDLSKGKLTLRTVLLVDTKIHLYQNSADSEPNYQFLSNLFSSNDNTTKHDTEFTIGSLIITRANLAYEKRWLEGNKDKFNLNNININNIHANLSIKATENEHINVRVRNFSCDENFGFSINKLQFALDINPDTIVVNNFTLKLPQSTITVPNEVTIINFKTQPCVEGELKLERLHTEDVASLLFKEPRMHYILTGTLNCQAHSDSTTFKLKIKELNDRMKVALTGSTTNKKFAVNFNDCRLDSTIVENISQIVPEKFQLIKNLGTCTLTGTAIANFETNHAKTQLNLCSPTIGNLYADATFNDNRLKLDLATQKTNLNNIFQLDILPETLTASGSILAMLQDSLLKVENIKFEIDSAYNKKWYNLCDIDAIIKVKNEDIECTLNSNTPHHAFNINSDLKLHKSNLTALAVNANVKNIDFNQIGYTDLIFSGKWKGMFALDVPVVACDKYIANLTVDSLSINRTTQSYQLDKCLASLNYTKGQSSTLRVRSDDISLDIDGNIQHDNIFAHWISTITNHVPAILSESKETHYTDNSTFNFNVRVHDGAFLKKLILLPLVVSDGSSIRGKYNNLNSFSEFSAHIEKLIYKESALDNLSLHLKSQASGAGLLLQGRKNIFNDDIQFVLGAQLHDNILETNVEWDGVNHHSFFGNISTLTNVLSKDEIITSVIPSTVHIEDSVWNISSGEIVIKNKEPHFNNLILNTSNQKLAISGGLSDNKHDSLQITLDNIDVGYILDKLNFTSVLFDGYATGKVLLSLNSSTPFLQTNLLVDSFRFNNTNLGDAKLTGKWKTYSLPIEIKGEFIEDKVSCTKAEGHIHPSKDSIDLHIIADNTNIEFLRYWVNNITENISGRTSGNCRLYGTFSNLDLSGKMNISTSLYVPSNGVTYNIKNAQVDISSGLFKLNPSTINSPKGGDGIVEAQLKHNNFRNFSYNLNLESNKLLLYDKVRTNEMPFYATTYASGKVRLDGKPGVLNLNVDVTPTDNSLIVYTESEVLSTNEEGNDFIVYRNLSKGQNVNFDINTFSTIHTLNMDMNMRFNINMNPAITLKVLMDEVTGDHLNLRGNGTLSANYYNKGTFQLYGNYDITGGNYVMSIQELLKKNLEIQNGSSIIFGGDPNDAQLNLKAVYTVPAASLADLNIGSNFSDRTIRANCVLNIHGTASNPSVNFDLDLPNINDDEKQMVHKLIATEDDLNMQVIHLLALGRFYTYDYALTESNAQQSQSTVTANSFLSSTISNQVNEVISNAIGTNDWTFGTNLSTGRTGWSDMEVDGVISGKMLNNRLLLNGNVGYHENQYNVTRGSNFVGDFSAQYLLSKNGGIRLKAYSETNDRYFTKSALTTQGFGIQIQKDFNRLKDLFTKSTKKN